QVGSDDPATATPTPAGGDEVLVGAYISNIQEIRPENNSYLASVYVWFRWRNPDLRPYETIDIVNVFESWGLTQTTTLDEPITQSDGSLYFVTRYQGSFNSPLFLTDFPFGTQYLQLVLEDFETGSEALTFVVGPESAAIDPGITIPGYSIGQPTIEAKDFVYSSAFGDLDVQAEESYSRVTVTIPVSPPGLPNVIKYLVPVLIVLVAASLAFFVPPTNLGDRIALGMTALLTLVAMQWSATEGLPSVSYLTLLDVVYLIGYVYVLACLGQSIRVAYLARQVSSEQAAASDRRTFVVVAGLLVLLSAAAFTIFLAR
ncbi:MAG: hypothetical protein ACKOT0_00560, partial [bacterium]